MLCAVLQAVDDYQDMLRISVASAANDHRLGAAEAPPAIISVFLGEELEEILEAIENDTPYGGKEKEQIKVGVHVLPKFARDTTDRNRTSPFAFTGNKFEFRMLGSSASISGANVVLNTAVAESLRKYADFLETADNFESSLHELIKSVIKKHKRIIFNGNGYGDEWIREAANRGLKNFRTTVDCVPYYLDIKNVDLFARHRVYSEIELAARYKMKLDNYCKVIRIEALTMREMVWKEIPPAVSAYSKQLCDTALAKAQLGADASFEASQCKKLSSLISDTVAGVNALAEAAENADEFSENYTRAAVFRDKVLPAMEQLRKTVDELETNTSAELWPFPTYGDILFSVR